MRKVLSIVLVLALVLGSTAFTFGAVPSDVSGTKYEDAVNVLMELDVISGYPDGSYKPAGIVTRGEMAKIIICALGLEDYAAGASSFKDMAGHWSDKYVAYAVSLGIINGYPDGTFKPDNTVSYDEAAKMLVAALGYTEAALVGTWPANWVTKAKTLGILDGIKNAGSTGANRGDIAIMAFQTLDQAVGKVNKDGEFVYDKDGGGNAKDTMLLRLGAKERVGSFVVDGNEKTIINLTPYIGALVTVYENSDNEIIAIKEVKTVFMTGERTGAGVFESDDVEYNISTAAGEGEDKAVLYVDNGKDSGTKKLSATSTEVKIAVELSGKRITDIWSISDWAISAHAKVEKTDLDAINAKTPKLLGKEFELNDEKEIDLKSFELVGVDSLDEIKADNIVYVYVGGGKITKVEVGTEVVEGEITRITGGNKWTVGGKAYKKASQDSGFAVATVLALENEVELFLDVDGKIYDAKKIEGEADKYGIAIAGEDAVGGIRDGRLKLYLPDGTKKIFDVDADEISGFNFGAAKMVDENDLVKYGLSADGKIDTLEIIDASSTPELEAASTAAITADGYIDTYKVAADAFVVTNATIAGTAFTSDDPTEFDYEVQDLSKLLDDTYTNILYVVNDDDQIEVLIIEGAGSGGDEIYGVLNGEFSAPKFKDGVIMLVGDDEIDYNADDNTQIVSDKYLYEIVEKTNGNVGLRYLDSGETEHVYEDVGIFVENNRFKNVAGTFNQPISKDLIVYEYDADDGWVKVSTSAIGKQDTVILYQTDSDNAELVTFALLYGGGDTIAPTVVVATTKMLSSSTFQVDFSEAVVAAKGDFKNLKFDADGDGTYEVTTLTVTSIAGSGTSTITVTLSAAIPSYAALTTVGKVDLGAGIKDFAGNALSAVTQDIAIQ
jgi:hypothetical protein